jgi:hypothetical protein
MKRFEPIAWISGFAVGIVTLLSMTTISAAQVSGANTFDVVAGDELRDIGKTSVSEFVSAIGDHVWIVGGTDVPGLKGRLQVAVLAAPAGEGDRSMSEWVFDQSEPFELNTKFDPGQSKDETIRSYAGNPAIEVGEALPNRRLQRTLDEVAYGEERPAMYGEERPPTPVKLPCCKPLDANTLMQALNEAGLVGDEGVLNTNGVLKEAHLLLALVPLPIEAGERKAPGFGDRRKSVGGVVFVLQAGE